MSLPRYGIINAPNEELNRSPAAQVIAQLSKHSGLFLTHFEHRHHLELPSYWIPENRPDLTGDLRWNRGVLKEHKYLHFRYDQPLGSFHPGHRAKWTAHELCHGLVGFAWNPAMTPFAHTLAARLSELLPVALWYFFDEVQLRRCPLHYLQGALFQDHCVYCDRAATQGPRLPEREDEEWVRMGIEFVRRELFTISRSRRFQRPLPHRYATLDLNSDAMAYVTQNHARMNDPLFRRFIELFHGPQTGMWADIDELEDRVWGLTEALSGGLPANPLMAGRSHWIAQDVGWRLLTVAAQCEDQEVIDHLEVMVEDLAKAPQSLHLIIQRYQAVFEDFFIPEPQEVFAVGYDLGGGWGWDDGQLLDGVASSCPQLEVAIGRESLKEQVVAFSSWDLKRPRRRPIGKRFSAFLSQTARGPISDLASYEAAIHHPDPPDPWAASLGWSLPNGDLVRRSQGVEVLQVSVEIDRFIEAIHSEEEIDIPEREHALVIVNQAGGSRQIAEISPKAVQSLARLEEHPMSEELLGLDEEELTLLKDIGAITPCAWILHDPSYQTDSFHRRVDQRSAEGGSGDDLNMDYTLLPDAVYLEDLKGLDPLPSAPLTGDEFLDDSEEFDDPDERVTIKPTPWRPEQAATEASAHIAQSVSPLTANALSPAHLGSARPPHLPSLPMNIEMLNAIIDEGMPKETPFSEVDYDEERPPENRFEERLRQELARQRAEKNSPFPQLVAEGEDLSLYEGLFNFEGILDGDTSSNESTNNKDSEED